MRRKLNLTLIGLSVVILLSVAMVAASRIAPSRIGPKGVQSTIRVLKVYDCYYVDCEPGCEEGKCLKAADGAQTRLSICGLTFTEQFTDYEVFVNGAWIGSKGDVLTACANADALGRVRYDIIIVATNPGKVKSALTGITLCLGAVAAPVNEVLVGSEYEQEHWDGISDIVLPEGDPNIGANVILCPAPPCP
jgi:hypothetical protein